MTTTTSITGSTTTATGSTAVQTATKSLLTALGSGSGVDTSTLVSSLVDAQFAARTARLTKQSETLTAQISGVSTLKSAIAGFAGALDALAKGGTLATAPKASNAAVLGATAIPGAKLSALASTIAVTQLAGGQSTATAKVKVSADPDAANATRSTVLGSGSFTLQLGTASYTTTNGKTTMGPLAPATGADTSVTFDLTDASVDSIAAAINAQGAKLGIAASVVTGADGSAYLSLKGASGADKAFTLTTAGDAALKQFEIGENATTAITAKAQNAQLTVDGIEIERASNSIDDLVAGVKLNLTATGTTTLTASRPTEGLTQAVADVAETYNQVLAVIEAQTNAASGSLNGDPAAQALLRSLRGLTLKSLNPNAAAGDPRTLAELGVKTARDGTLSVDTTALAKILADKPDAVEAMFASSAASTTGLPAIMNTLSKAATATTAGLGASATRYARAQTDLTTAQGRIKTESEAMSARLTSQYAAMNARVTAYKATQSFLTNQIAAWNKADS